MQTKAAFPSAGAAGAAVPPSLRPEEPPALMNAGVGFAFALVCAVAVWFLVFDPADARVPLPSAAEREARASARMLEGAFTAYYHDHRRLPSPASHAGEARDGDTDSSSASGLVRILLTGEPAWSTRMRNSQRVNYLQNVKAARLDGGGDGRWVNGLVSEGGDFALLDAWGNPWRIRLDHDGDGLLANPDPEQAGDGRPLIPSQCLIWSPGKDGREETWEDNPRSWN